MILVIRFIGIINAAIWLGAAVFFTLGAAPAFFSNDAKGLGISPFWTGAMAQLVLTRYFYFQYVCSSIAVVHLLAEWIYLGRRLHRITVALLIGLVLIGFAGGLVIQPKLKKLNLVKYSMSEHYKPVTLSAEERVAAAKSFSRWHGVSQVLNLCALLGLITYFWRVTHPAENTRFVSATKFRS